MTVSHERLCRYCGDPLPRQEGRSRPRVAHEGECSRKYHNRRRLNSRIERFRAAHRADRSDECPWAASQYDSGDYDAEGFRTSRGAFDDVHGRALIDAMNSWELLEKVRKAVARADYQAHEAARKLQRLEQEPHPYPLTEEQKASRALRVAYWKARARGGWEND